MSKLSRRETLARGGQAVAAAAVLSTLPSIAGAKEDAELFALYEECRRLEKKHTAVIIKQDETSMAVRKAFREPPTSRELWKRVQTPGTPERIAVIDHPGGISAAIADMKRNAKKQWQADLAEAEKQAGVPALEKKYEDTARVWFDAVDRFYDTRANTPAGVTLKFTVTWGERGHQNWRAKDLARVDFTKSAMASALVDLERLSGRAI